MRKIFRVLAAAALVSAAACDSPTVDIDLRVHHVVAGPDQRVLTVGDTMQVTAYPTTESGLVLGGLRVDWESDAAAVAEVRGNSTFAIVEAKAPGATTIRAMVDGKVGRINVTVVAAQQQVHHIAIVPGGGALQVGAEAGVEALLYAADGTVIGGRPIEWTSSNGPVLTVTSVGNPAYAMLRGQSAGIATITARSGGVTASVEYVVVAAPQNVARIEITPAVGNMGVGGSMTIHALLYAADSTQLHGHPVVWTTSNPSVVTVNAFPETTVARLSGVAPGPVTITARVGNITRTAEFEVFAPMPPPPVAVAYVLVQPLRRGLWEMQAYRFQARTLQANGIELTGRSITWDVENAAVARIDSAGVAIAQTAGTTLIEATSEGVQGHAELYVYPLEQRMTFELTFDWYDGQVHYTHPMGMLQWTDSSGVVRDTPLQLYSGTFTIDRNTGTYERVITAVAWFHDGMTLREVGRRTYTDDGTMYYVWNPYVDGATTFSFVSAVTSGLTYSGSFRSGGEILVNMPMHAGEVREVLFRLAP